MRCATSGTCLREGHPLRHRQIAFPTYLTRNKPEARRPNTKNSPSYGRRTSLDADHDKTAKNRVLQLISRI